MAIRKWLAKSRLRALMLAGAAMLVLRAPPGPAPTPATMATRSTENMDRAPTTDEPDATETDNEGATESDDADNDADESHDGDRSIDRQEPDEDGDGAHVDDNDAPKADGDKSDSKNSGKK